MTKRDSNRAFQGFSSQRSWVISGIGWLGSISLLGTGMAYAQVQSPAPPQAPSADGFAVPGAQDLLYPAAPENPDFSAATDSPPSVELEPLNSAEPAIDSFNGADSLVSPNLANDAEAAFGQGNGSLGGASYIDSTPYDVGATSPDVVLSERSTGCQAVLQAGQSVSGSICPEAPAVAFSNGSSSEGVSGGGFSGYPSGSVTLPSLQDFYNLTVRPPAKLSNGNINLLFPLSIPAVITSAFGWRIHPIAGESRFHSGTDIGAPQGTPVLAVFEGKVEIADLMGGYGLAVVLRHNNDAEKTLYGHLSEIFVKPGKTVKQGEVIGRVGSTGYSTGPHLHFEFHKLTPEGWAMLDPGQALEYSLAQLIHGVKGGTDAKSPFSFVSWKNFHKALKMAEAKPQKGLSSSQPRPETLPNSKSGL